METDQIAAGEFKTHCLKLLDKVNNSGRPLVVTKHGKPVARIMPIQNNKKKNNIFGCMKGTGSINGDIITPMTSLWNLPE